MDQDINLLMPALAKSDRSNVTNIRQMSGPPSRQIDLSTILEVARTYLNMETGFVSEFRDGKRYFRHVSSCVANAPGIGGSDPLEETYCKRIADGFLDNLIPDTMACPDTSSLPVTDQLNIGSYAGVPIVLSDGEIYGSFCCYSSKTNQSLTQNDLRMLVVLAGLAAMTLEVDMRRDQAAFARREEIKLLLQEQRVHIVLQPIVRFDTEEVSGFEALARFEMQPVRPPNLIFDQAEECDRDVELELVCLEKALQLLRRLAPHQFLSINLSPKAMLDPAAKLILGEADLSRLVLELTEHCAVEDYEILTEALKDLRAEGLMIAVDDTGSGYASFQHVLNLQPDIVKLDRQMVSGIDRDEARQALAKSIIDFSRSVGYSIVAEGIETLEEFNTLKDLGATRAQGYFIAKPAPLDQFHIPRPRPCIVSG